MRNVPHSSPFTLSGQEASAQARRLGAGRSAAGPSVFITPATGRDPDQRERIQRLDQSLHHALNLRVPRSELGGAANQAIAGLVWKAGAAGIDLNAAPEIPLGIRIGETVTSPSVTAT